MLEENTMEIHAALNADLRRVCIFILNNINLIVMYLNDV
jgi:hypothetical protein